MARCPPKKSLLRVKRLQRRRRKTLSMLFTRTARLRNFRPGFLTSHCICYHWNFWGGVSSLPACMRRELCLFFLFHRQVPCVCNVAPRLWLMMEEFLGVALDGTGTVTIIYHVYPLLRAWGGREAIFDVVLNVGNLSGRKRRINYSHFSTWYEVRTTGHEFLSQGKCALPSAVKFLGEFGCSDKTLALACVST